LAKEILMPDERVVPRSVGKSAGVWVLAGLLATAGGLWGLSCTDNSGNGNFIEHHGAPDGGDAAPATDGSADHTAAGDAHDDAAHEDATHSDATHSDALHVDGLASDLLGDH
jgi:hypothetical protein